MKNSAKLKRNLANQDVQGWNLELVQEYVYRWRILQHQHQQILPACRHWFGNKKKKKPPWARRANEESSSLQLTLVKWLFKRNFSIKIWPFSLSITSCSQIKIILFPGMKENDVLMATERPRMHNYSFHHRKA